MKNPKTFITYNGFITGTYISFGNYMDFMQMCHTHMPTCTDINVESVRPTSKCIDASNWTMFDGRLLHIAITICSIIMRVLCIDATMRPLYGT